MRKITFCITILLFSCHLLTSLYGQESNFLRGKVLDQKTAEPVVFATVRIKGMAKGVITNMDGSFRLPLQFREDGKSIVVSSMGYEKKEYALQRLSPKDINVIYLVPSTISLTEAIVSAKKKRDPSARQIIKRAIENIPNNYPNTNYTLKGYYRDYQLDTLGYVNLNEALLAVFDKGFDEIDTATTRTQMYEYRQNFNFRRDTLADDAYDYRKWRKIIDNAYLSAHGGNEFQILRVHDAIRNYRIGSYDFVGTLNQDLIKNHSFKRLSDTNLDNEQFYTIQIKKVFPDFEARGKIFISKDDYAINKLAYAVFDDNKRNNDSILRNKGIKGEPIFEVTTEYQRALDDKLYLNYISLHNTFQLAKPPKFIVSYLMVFAEEGTFNIHFNNRLALGQDVKNSKRYSFQYKGEKIRFKNITKENDTLIKLYPDMKQEALDNMMREIDVMNRKNINLTGVLEFSVNGLIDVEGNLLNTWTYKNYNQFREFFVQEHDKRNIKALDSLFMDKRKPIFDNQPIVKPDNVNEYWMNTPLKKVN
ncbi:carboxypeptidase-like regulatory domain-containing protein [Maribacter sp. CXY002]|uniref:carboxypeptidase-like regulatory domain-containing protein n=1 Tax=Maribacter luteocoastalis TaxID=3407671 RepID=UPI003B67D116